MLAEYGRHCARCANESNLATNKPVILKKTRIGNKYVLYDVTFTSQGTYPDSFKQEGGAIIYMSGKTYRTAPNPRDRQNWADGY